VSSLEAEAEKLGARTYNSIPSFGKIRTCWGRQPSNSIARKTHCV